MDRMVNLSDLLDAAGVADLLGLGHRNSVTTYRSRYGDFPEPVIDMGSGRCLLWLRSDIEEWTAQRRPSTRKRRRKPDDAPA